LIRINHSCAVRQLSFEPPAARITGIEMRGSRTRFRMPSRVARGVPIQGEEMSTIGAERGVMRNPQVRLKCLHPFEPSQKYNWRRKA